MARVWAGRTLVPPHLRGKRARVRVTSAQRAALARNDLRAWRRATAVLLCLDGLRIAQICIQLGVHNSAVTKWLARYVSEGFAALSPRKAPGRKASLDAGQLEEVAELIEKGPVAAGFPSGIWTARLVAKLIKDRYGIEYSWKYVPELLHRMGFSVQRPRKLLSRADHEAQQYWLRVTFPAIKKTPQRRAASSCSKTKQVSNSTLPCTELGRG